MHINIHAREYVEQPHLAAIFDDESFVYAEKVDRIAAERVVEMYRSLPPLQAHFRSILARKNFSWEEKSAAIARAYRSARAVGK